MENANKPQISRWTLTRTVAIWEFKRFYKIWDELKGIALMLVFAAVGFFGATWIFDSGNESRTIAITDNPWYVADSLSTSDITYIRTSPDTLDAAREQVRAGDLNALIRVVDAHNVELIVGRNQGWTEMLKMAFQPLHLTAIQQQWELTDTTLAQIRSGIDWTVTPLKESAAENTISRVIAFVSIGLLLMAVFLGFAYQFTAITGEKTTKMTEMMLGIISPQTWIDGKILGITAIGLVKVATFSVIGILGGIALLLFTGSDPLMLILQLQPLTTLLFFTMALLGILMWNAFLAGVASTIDDPNTSERSGLMFLPMLPVMLSAFAIFNPDSTAMKILTVFPLTSSAVLPVRMVLTEVAWWEILASVVLLAGTVLLFRRIAGKIFAYSVLMYGKEPSWREMWSVLRRS